MSNLYELTGKYLQLQEMLESGDYDEQTLAETLEGIEGEIEIKADNYARVIRNLEAEAEAYKAEADRFTDKRRKCENAVKRLKANLKAAMQITGKTKFKTNLFSFSIRANGGALPVVLDVDEGDLPDTMKVFTSKPDLKAIASAIEAGDCDFAHFGERGENLRIE